MGFGTLFFGPSDAHYLEEINGMPGIPTGSLWTGGHSATAELWLSKPYLADGDRALNSTWRVTVQLVSPGTSSPAGGWSLRSDPEIVDN